MFMGLNLNIINPSKKPKNSREGCELKLKARSRARLGLAQNRHAPFQTSRFATGSSCRSKIRSLYYSRTASPKYQGEDHVQVFMLSFDSIDGPMGHGTACFDVTPFSRPSIGRSAERDVRSMNVTECYTEKSPQQAFLARIRPPSLLMQPSLQWARSSSYRGHLESEPDRP